MAQGVQTLAPQGAAAQPTATPVGTFADAIAAVTADEGAFLARHGNDNPSSHSLNGTAAPLGATSNSVNGALPTTTQPTPGLTAPLASPQWQQGLGQQLVALHQRGGQQVELHLHPAELGPLSISLKVDDQLAQAQFFSANPQVRAAIEQAIPQLREALEESGIQLGEAMVGEQQHRDDGQEQKQGKGDLDGLTNGVLASSGDTALADQPSAVIGPDSNAIDLYA
ncbi:flagellar hook-length control protein FliK [Modicisalibacter luteus]